MARSAIRTSARRTALSSALGKSSMYAAMGQKGIGDIITQGIYARENARQQLYSFGSELITYLDKRKEDKKERLDIELGVAVAESNTGIKVNYDKVTLLDILSGQGSRKDWGEESFSFGNKKYTPAQLIALAQTHKNNEMAFLAGEADAYEPSSLDRTSGWTYEVGETQAIRGTGRQGIKIARAFDEKKAYAAGEALYREGGDDAKLTHGLYQWSTRGGVVSKMIEDLGDAGSANYKKDFFTKLGWSDSTIEGGRTADEFKKLYDTATNKLTTEKEKKVAKAKLKEYYKDVSDKMSWEEVAPYIRTEESSDAKDPMKLIGKNIVRDKAGNIIGGAGFDIGPYQINTRFLIEGEDSYQFLEGTKTEYKAWTSIDKALMEDFGGDVPEPPTNYFGEKEGFDWSDISGEQSIWKKYRNQDSLDPYAGEVKNALMHFNLIDKDWQLYDTNL